LAEGQQRLPLAAGSGATLGNFREKPFVAFALQWYGIPLAAAFALFAAAYYIISPEHLRPIYDDSYISLNFARNIAEHGKLSFDGKEWTTGATSPLHVLIMGILLKLGVPAMTTSIGVGVVCHALLAVGVYLMAYAIFRSQLAGILGALAMAFTSYAVLDAGNGLETSLFMALVAFAAASYFWSPRPAFRIACGVLIALAVLTRPEGAFLLPAAVGYRWVDRAEGEPIVDFVKDAARLAVPGLIAGALLVGFSLIVSGTIGGTASAKLQFFQEDQAPLQYKVGVASEQIGIFVQPLVPLIALAAIVAGRKAMVFFALFWVPVVLMYVDLFPGGLAHYFYRYQHPVLPFLAAFAGGGAAYLIAVAAKRDIVVKAMVVGALAVVVVPMYHEYLLWRDTYTAAAEETYNDLEPMAKDLNTIVRPDQTLATHDIGAVQYFAHYKVLDLVGLANEDVIPYHNGRHVVDYIDKVKPDYLLIFPDWDTFFLHLDAKDHPEKYEFVKSYGGGPTRQDPYILYRVHYQ
jgi:hypothetical protein